METLEQKIAQILQENKAQLVASLLARTSPTGISVQLQEALDSCMRGTDKAQDEINKLRLQYAKKPDEYTEYQINLIDKQTKRAVKEAERRANLIKTLKTKEAREAELLRCKNDTVYWFKNWAWTLDPRADSPLSVIPFLPFGFQEELILWLEDLIFTQRTDGLIEKSRDMGVSWIATAFVVKHWLFNDRFDALLGSRKEELVDSMGEMESLFEKIRFQIKLLPDWMLPPGFESKRDINFCRIINPHTGSTIGGESSNPDFGRAGRYSFVLLDEFASFPHGGYEAWAGCSQSSRSKISISTPKGKLNKHADLRFSRGIAGMAVKSIHWKRHPWKTEVWYRAQAKTMNKAEIAQELDIDYEASQPGQIFPMWSELYHVITWSEFADYFGEMAVENWDAALNGTEKPIYQIPRHWQLGRAQDWGCLPLDTEILTMDGWKAHDQVRVGELIAGYDWKDKRKIVWSPLKHKVYKNDMPLVEMRSKSFRFVCTPDHGWVVKRPRRGSMTRDTYARQELNKIPRKNTRLVVTAECEEAGLLSCSPAMAAVLGWLVTDGWVEKFEHGANIAQKNYVEEVIRDLKESGLPWKENKTNKQGVRIFRINRKGWIKLKEETGFQSKSDLSRIVTSLSPEARKAMLTAMLLAEGTDQGCERKTIFCQKPGHVSDAFQILATLCGIRLGLQREHQSGWGSSSRIPLLRQKVLNYPRITEIPGTHRTWCPVVEEQAVVVRQRGQVTITGNSTEQHRCVTLYAARPGEGDKLRDSVFIFREYLPEVGATPRQVAKGIRQLEAQGREHERMAISVMSHEAKSERDTYCKEHALPFEPWATDYNAGIAQVQNYLEIRKNIPHPFRNYLTGTPRLFLIVDDTQGAAYWESEGARYIVKQPTDHKGLERLRMEMPRYHYPAAEEGKAVALRRPFKLYDDAIDCLRALAAMWFPQASLLTDEELKEKRLSKSLRRENIPNINPQDLASYWLSRQMALGELKDGERKDKHWRDKFWESNRGE